jgi:GT2 family glycosyltransferase
VIVFPTVARPSVSVVVVAYGQHELVVRALDALLANTPGVYEVIVVDNASPDGTGDRLAREVEGITLLRAQENLGFGRAANWGAMASRSRFLCFLNSDAFVHEGWLEPLVRRLTHHPRVAAVVPRVLNLDGTLQEAGTVVGGEGATFSVGFGDDAARPAYRFPRVIDYGSAACLLVRRAAFARAGGFDVAYGLGYCEDVDFAFALAREGLLTMYEPRSVVSHVRHGSSSADAAAERVKVNRATLVERWWRRLASRPPLADLENRPHRIVALRDADATATVLVVAGRVPRTDAGTDRFASAPALRALLERAPALRVTLLLLDPAAAERDAAAYWDAGVEVVFGEPDWEAWLGTRRFHYSIVVVDGDGAGTRLDPALRATQPQAVRVDPDAPHEVAEALLSIAPC